MPKKTQIVLIIIFSIFLVSCGYKKINQKDTPIIYIKTLEYTGDKRLGYLIKNQVLLISQKNAKNNLEINLSLDKNKTPKDKNEAGKIIKFTVALNVDLTIKNLDNMKTIDKSFVQAIDYNVQKNHFETINEEKSVTINIAERIAEDIIRYLTLSYGN